MANEFIENIYSNKCTYIEHTNGRERASDRATRMQLFVIIWKEIWLKSHECQWRKRKKRPQAELFNQIQYICHISYTNSVKVFAAASIWHVTWHTNILQKPQFCRTELFHLVLACLFLQFRIHIVYTSIVVFHRYTMLDSFNLSDNSSNWAPRWAC